MRLRTCLRVYHRHQAVDQAYQRCGHTPTDRSLSTIRQYSMLTMPGLPGCRPMGTWVYLSLIGFGPMEHIHQLYVILVFFSQYVLWRLVALNWVARLAD